MRLFRGRLFFGLGIALAALVVAGGGYYLLRYKAWSGYRSWSIGRMNGMARDFVTANDPRNALLTVRKVLRSRPNDVEAWQLGVKAAEMTGSNEAVLFQRNLCRVQKTTANYIELMRLSLKYEAYNYAVEAIGSVAPDARKLPEYHRLAADIFRHVNRELPAKYHLISLLSIEPADVPARMALAEVEFAIDPKKVPSDWVQRVDALAKIPETELAANFLKLRAAVIERAPRDAAALVAKLQTRADLTLAQRLNILDAAYLYDAKLAVKSLADLQEQVASSPKDVVQVMQLLTAQANHAAIKSWYPTLPEAVRQDERVKLISAESLLALRDWSGLENLLRGAPWKTDEYLRMSLLSYVLRLTGRSADAAESWKIAMISAGKDPRKLTRLLRSVETWQWDAERYELLWRLFSVMPTNATVQQFLVAREYQDGKTVNLNKIYARLIEANPGDNAARNNFAYTSLLLDTNTGRAQTIARELFKQDPANVSYRTTYTLALHKQGQSREALALMDELSSTVRLAPVQMVHEAAYAAASGQIDRAAALMPELDVAKLLPEQRALVAAARGEIVRLKKAQGNETRLVSLSQSGPTAGGWMELLPARAGEGSVEFKLSDSYFRDKNMPALRELLRNARWEKNDHLRSALLAYVFRSEANDNLVRDAWKQAVNSAARDAIHLRELETLARSWGWTGERIEVVARIFERESGNRAMLTDLLDYYRSSSRTSDMARVLWLYVNQTNTTGREAAWCVYYSLLCGTNISPAQTLAVKVYEKAPNDPLHRVAYAFALWRQQRSGEALKLIQDIDAPDLTGMQVSLVEAGALLELGRKEEAKEILRRFTSVNAVPEEINLAATLFRQAGLPNAVNAFTWKK